MRIEKLNYRITVTHKQYLIIRDALILFQKQKVENFEVEKKKNIEKAKDMLKFLMGN